MHVILSLEAWYREEDKKKKTSIGAEGDGSEWQAPSALPELSGLRPNTHKVAHNHLQLQHQ